jgi:hypothetical protein
MKLKIDDKGAVVVQDGKPVYVHDDGKEVPFDAAGALSTIGRLNGEAKSHREGREAAEGRLKSFDGIDPEQARTALQTVAGMDAKKLIDAGEATRVRDEAIKATEDKYRPLQKKVDALEGELRGEKIGGSFARSKFISEKLTITPDLVQARFGDRFKLEDGKVVAYDSSGNKIYSRTRPGETAEFDEAIETIVDQYPYRDNILRAPGASGSGARGSGSQGSGGGARTMPRSHFETLNQMQRAAALKDGTVLIEG